MKKVIVLFFTLSLAGAACLYLYVHNIISKMESLDPLVWERDIQKLEESDKGKELSSNSWLFVGSSSVALYDGLEELMHPHQVIQKGFGGASANDIVFFQDRIVDKFKPTRVVIYAGAVDAYIQNPKNPSLVVQSITELFESIHKKNRGASIYYVAIRPSPFEPDMLKTIEFINNAIFEKTKQSEHIAFIDGNYSVKNDIGDYRKDIYKLDRTHLDNTGNALWWSAIRELLLEHPNTTVQNDRKSGVSINKH